MGVVFYVTLGIFSISIRSSTVLQFVFIFNMLIDSASPINMSSSIFPIATSHFVKLES